MQTIDFQKLGIFPGARILDLGCGFGRHSWHAFHYPGVRIVAADIDPGRAHANKCMLANMAEKEIHGGGSACVVCADARKLPFADGSFDLIVCSELMEHIDDDAAAAAELYRVLAADGCLGVSVPSAFPERVCWKLYQGYPEMAEGHRRIYTERGLCELFAGAGFISCERARAHALDTPYWWLRCLAERFPAFSGPARRYKAFLDGSLARPTAFSLFGEKALRPLLAKSRVLYLKKNKAEA